MDRNCADYNYRSGHVALRKESVDRNIQSAYTFSGVVAVALRKESVDRNRNKFIVNTNEAVALRKESVDRNAYVDCQQSNARKSLSARRAWIEISTQCKL